MSCYLDITKNIMHTAQYNVAKTATLGIIGLTSKGYQYWVVIYILINCVTIVQQNKNFITY